jgi:hypothetical protein
LLLVGVTRAVICHNARNEQCKRDKFSTSKNYPSLQKINKNVFKTNAAMLLKKKKRIFKHIIPQYIHIKVNGNNPLSMPTKNEQSNIEITKRWVTESVYEMLQKEVQF